MRIVEIAISAILGGAVGFAASQYAGDARQPAETASIAALVDEGVAARLDDLGIGDAAALGGRISGGVAQFLADQPEAIVAALEQHQANQAAQEEEDRRQTLASLGDALTNQPGDPAFGADADVADIVLVEFFDYRCGYCKRSLESVLSLTAEDAKLRVVLKEFPILGPESVAAAQISLAAYAVDPKAHKDLHTRLMLHRGGYDRTTLLGLAAKAGYDPVAIEAAMANGAVQAQIRHSYEIAEALGIRGTPAFIIGESVIPGAVSQSRLRQEIEGARAAKKG